MEKIVNNSALTIALGRILCYNYRTQLKKRPEPRKKYGAGITANNGRVNHGEIWANRQKMG